MKDRSARPHPPHPRRRGRSRRFGRRTRWAVWLALLIPGVLAAAGLLATQTVAAKWIVLPRLRQVLDLEIDAQRVMIARSGVLVLRGVTCRVPDLSGPGGQVLSARRIALDIDWNAAARGRARIRSIELSGTVVRLSQSIESGAINLGEIPLPSGVGRGATQLPIIFPTDILLELGEHDDRKFTALRVLHLEGRVGFAPDSTSYFLSLAESAGARPGGGLALRGLVGDWGTDLQLTGLSLESWPIRAGARRFSEELALEGSVQRATFRSHDQDFRLEADLAGVAMNLPWLSDQPGEPMRLRGVDGRMVFLPHGAQADLTGNLEDLPCRVTLIYDGFEESSPFRGRIECRNYHVGEDPALLPFLSQTVQRRFGQFSGPTAVVDAVVNVWRDPTRGEGIGYDGTVRFRRGVASFERFPYRFDDLEGVVRFDADAITIERVEGLAPTGATLVARGHISPPEGRSVVEINVDVAGVPIDETLAAGMGPERAGLLDAALSRERLDDLVERGVVARPGEGVAGGAPEFALGGVGSAAITIRRTAEGEWTDEVRVNFPTLGVLPEHFPYPMVGRDVTILIADHRASVEGATLRGIDGGEVTAEVELPLDKSVGPTTIRLHAAAVPLTPVVLDALPDADVGDGRRLRALLADLDLGGTVGAGVSVATGGDGGVTYEALVEFPAVRVAPAQAPGAPSVPHAVLSGELRASPGRVAASFEGELMGPGESGPFGRVAIEGATGLANGALEATASLDDLDLTGPLEDLVRVIDPEGADRIAAVREKFRPRGVADIRVRAGAGPVEAEIADAREIEFDTLGGRLAIMESSGSLSIRPGGQGGGASLEFRDFHAGLSFNGEPGGEVSARGSLRLTPQGGLADGDLTGSLDGARFESPLSRALISARSPEALRSGWLTTSPEGGYDLKFALRPEPAPGYAVEVLPRSLAITRRGQRVAAAAMEGKIRLTPGAGRAVDLAASGAGWTIRAAGDWAVPPGGEVSLNVRFSVDAESLTDELRSLLPEEIAGAFDSIALSITEPFSLREGVLRGRLHADQARRSGTFNALAEFSGASLDTGIAIDRAAGRATVSATLAPGDRRPWYSIGFDLATMRAAGLNMGRSAALVEGTPDGVVALTAASASCHGGMVTATGEVRPPASPDAPRLYAAEATLADVRFGPVLGDLLASRRTAEGAPEDAAPGPATLDETRGAVNAGLSITGELGRPQTRRGRGHATIYGQEARIMRLPLVLPLIEASNLALPTSSRLEFARADFFLDGDTIAFEDLSIESQAVWIRGYGTVTWPDLALDLQFNSGSARRIPVVSAIVEGLRNEIISTSVKGRLDDPKVSLDQFAGTRRFFRDALGGRASTQQERLGDLAGQSGPRPRVDTADIIRPSSSPAVEQRGVAKSEPGPPEDRGIQPPPQEHP